MQAASPLLSLSPSFNSYSSNKLAEIAARVVQEFSQESGFDDFHPENQLNFDKSEEDVNNDEDDDEEEEEEFEFAFVCKESQMSPISADEIFYNGQIRPVFPIVDTSLLLSEVNHQTIQTNKLNPSPKPIRFPLRKLFEELDPPSSSSSEADDLEGIQAGTYCVWTPKTRDDERCKKSNSTGSSKRWKFKDLLHHQRSNSDGKDTFVFLTPSNSKKKKEEEKPSKEEVKSENDVVKRRFWWVSY
ncbi:Protein of unknown function DUF1645, plant [Dillenia turbinata]|uniref:Uncharacterized protein n=1 Tax=Dillenia turbinata TaxID=194707 RepID=A0AAN8VBY0_9MAGN